MRVRINANLDLKQWGIPETSEEGKYLRSIEGQTFEVDEDFGAGMITLQDSETTVIFSTGGDCTVI